ncbi:MAG: TIGR02147 family protein [Fibrobacter sp.]|nr:TIGR02147 family protein [Fibrobacter sp.]
MKTIYAYVDYRLFLKDYYEEKKKKCSFFSYRYFSQKAGINSPNFLKLVIEADRNLTALTIDRFITALNFDEKEASYFRHLVLFNQAKTAAEKQRHYKVMLTMMHAVKEQSLTALQHEYFNYWFVPVIRELVSLYNFNGDYKELASMLIPQITVREAKFAVNLLIRIGMIKKNDDGTYCQTAAAIKSDSSIGRMAVRAFNREMLVKAESAIDNLSIDERQIFGVTVGISEECYNLLATEMTAFRDRVVAIVNADRCSSRVYQMNLQLFPLSQAVPLGSETRSENEISI